MLKRQRPISPPPSNPTVPLVESSAYNMISKRRRTMPPPLDGQSRGCGAEPDYDDEWSDGESACQEGGSATTSEQLDNSGEYKSTNTFLHELHTLQQHRLLFSPPLLPQTSSGPGLCRSSLQHPCSSPVISNIHLKTMAAREHQIPSSTERSATPIKDAPFSIADVQRPMEETLRVKERYEETNRFVHN